MRAIVTVLLWFGVLGCGVIAGLYFAFSSFIMTALSRVGPAGAAAMNSINAVILQSAFMPLFFGTTVASLALAVIAALRWNEPGSMLMLTGGLLYVFGMFIVTMAFNVPLNNALAAAAPARAEGAEVWTRYLTDWTLWNHVRTIASIGASALFVAALLRH